MKKLMLLAVVLCLASVVLADGGAPMPHCPINWTPPLPPYCGIGK